MARRLVGLDIGYLHLRAVALAPQGKSGWRILDHAEVSRFDDLGKRKPLSRALAELDSRLPLNGELSVASSDLATMVRFEHNTPMPPDRIERVLRLELSQHAGDDGDIAGDAVAIPLAADEIIHCCGLAQPPQVLALLQELRSNGIRPQRVQLAPAAGVNALAGDSRVVGAEGFRLLVDIGSRSVRVVLVRGPEFLACRQLPFGGDRFTEALAKAHGLRFDQAEQIKCGLQPMPDGRPEAPDENAETQPGDDAAVFDEGGTTVLSDDDGPLRRGKALWQRQSGGFLLDEPEPEEPGQSTVNLGVESMGGELREVAEELFVQVGKTVAWFRAQLRCAKLEFEEVVLAGAGANLGGLALYLQQRFGRPVRLADPCGAFAGRGPERPHEYQLAFGLALSGARNATAFDLTPESVQRRRLFWQQVVWPRVAAALVLLAAGIGGFALYEHQEHQQQRLQRYVDQKEEYQRSRGEFDGLRSEHDGMLTDLRGIGARIFAGRDLLYLIRVLKEKAPRELWITQLTTVKPVAVEPKQPGAAGRRPVRGDARSTPASRQDTAIDHGGIFIAGKIKPEGDPAVLHGHFYDWFRGVIDWVTPSESRLFRSGEELRNDIQKATRNRQEDALFEVRFDFHPTELSEVLAMRSREAP